jgi:hyperosmotically inducible protein
MKAKPALPIAGVTMRRAITFIVVLGCVLLAGVRPVSAGQISDGDLAERIAAAVRDYPRFGMFYDISIRVDNRAVTLSGRVTSPNKKIEIERAVSKVDGIRTLTNEIGVLPVSTYDSELRDRLARAIYGHPSFRHYAAMPNPPIHIVVENGRVTLTGAVDNQVERMLAFSLAQVPGVFSVKNDLKTDR